MTESKEIRLECLRLATSIANRLQLVEQERIVDIASTFEQFVESGKGTKPDATSAKGEETGKPASDSGKKRQPKPKG